MSNELILKAASIMKEAEIAAISLIDENGFPRTSTISSLKTEGVKHAWFTTGFRSGKAKCISIGNKAGLCYCDGNNNVTLMGTIEILSDLDTKKEFWDEGFYNHFPEGATDPNYCILKFSASKVVLWVDSEYIEVEI